jgi:hypothetical protein
MRDFRLARRLHSMPGKLRASRPLSGPTRGPGGHEIVIARSIFGRALAVALSLALSQLAVPIVQAAARQAAPTQAAVHLVAGAELQARLADAAAARAAQVRVVQSVLDSPEARRQAGVLGVDAGRLRAAVPHLSEAELADLASRAAQVKDVAAGHQTHDGLAIVGIVLLLAGLVVLAAVSGYDDSYDDCGCY